ncbi:nickel-dependent hydrogenase large subunit, partial [uncultured Mailhella sp.]|uniref:nickel-dependent hydrogenase large subunit n=1 Tax=uncultured Mailhella sp. TaxID=1981031 RepID=UPI0025EB5CFB
MSEAKTTPQSSYTGPIVVDPLTRIEGHLRIEVEVENGRVKDARSCSTLFRGLETILKGRDPRDAQFFTGRTCGVCTYTHALASTRALEDAMQIEIPVNATLIRNLVLGMQNLHDHVVHFYHLHALDFVDVAAALQADPAKAAKLNASISPRPTSEDELRAVQAKVKALVESGQLGPFTNAYFLGGHPSYYLDPEANLVATAHYLEALRVQVEIARATAVFGAKNPHPQFLIAGGVTCYNALRPDTIAQFKALYQKARAFVEQVYIPDLLLVAGAYKDWASIGGGVSDYMDFGEFPGKERDLTTRWLKPGVIYNRDLSTVLPFDPSKISEHVRHSWYEGDEARAPYQGVTDPRFTRIGDTDRYSWMKAPRYDGHTVETGPLAQMLISYAQGDKLVTS